MEAKRLALSRHQTKLRKCTRCPEMKGPVVVGRAVASPVLLVGQAPGTREIETGRPFAWTAGKTLFGWFDEIGMNEARFRESIYMAAVCRCFPGKNPKGGDRVPSRDEIDHCSHWLDAEIALLEPRLIIAVGKLAISRFMAVDKLNQVVGAIHPVERPGLAVDLAPLPHPSGASTWHRTEPGKSLLQQALQNIRLHPAWRQVCPTKS